MVLIDNKLASVGGFRSEVGYFRLDLQVDVSGARSLIILNKPSQLAPNLPCLLSAASNSTFFKTKFLTRKDLFLILTYFLTIAAFE